MYANLTPYSLVATVCTARFDVKASFITYIYFCAFLIILKINNDYFSLRHSKVFLSNGSLLVLYESGSDYMYTIQVNFILHCLFFCAPTT
jgi:hypothetical protein